jgi:hypothetical protein
MNGDIDVFLNQIEIKSITSQRIVKFNIGGTIFATFASTICKKIPKPYLSTNGFYRPNLLERILLGDVKPILDDQKCIFMDRSSKYFDCILDYLRASNTNEDFFLPKNKIFLKELLREAKFYEIDSLKDLIKEHYNCLVRNHKVLRQKESLNKKEYQESHQAKSNAYLEDSSYSSNYQTNYLTSTAKNSDITSYTTFIRKKELNSRDTKQARKHGLDNTLLFAELKKLKNDPNASKWIYGRVSSDCDGTLLCHEMQVNDDTLITNDNKAAYTVFENCTIIFIISSQCFYVQMQSFEKELARIQPRIDNCLEPLEPDEVLCIGQYKEDGLYYRCRILNWYEDKNEAECLFIDFGNTEFVQINTITKMSVSLKEIKPLALCCKLDKELKCGTREFQQLIDLVNQDTLFDIRVKKFDLESFYFAENYVYDPIEIELSTSSNKIKINEENLSRQDLWN